MLEKLLVYQSGFKHTTKRLNDSIEEYEGLVICLKDLVLLEEEKHIVGNIEIDEELYIKTRAEALTMIIDCSKIIERLKPVYEYAKSLSSYRAVEVQ
ncbi:MAG: hypothetical protein FWC41_07700 [Firmicutes bacterium]|nr:hypothetical protein [Bacillota bacterium]